MKIIQVVGARPNFMKVAPLHKAFQGFSGIESIIVHTGQHFDKQMSTVFFEQLALPVPDFYLGVTGGSHTKMTAEIMLAFEKVLEEVLPDLVVVVGDVTSTIACALTAVRLRIPVAHVEAGLRSNDLEMPEEINRILTDRLSKYLFTTESSANLNLIQENVSEQKIHFVGNCMIDSLQYYLPKAIELQAVNSYGLGNQEFAVMTMHRPSNVDDQNGLKKILDLIVELCKRFPLVFPVHPRTRKNMERFQLLEQFTSIPNLIITEPLAYLEFISLMNDCSLILTDSGGIQEESTYLQIPCLTFRKSTERPVTVEIGTNILIDDLDVQKALLYVDQIRSGQLKKGQIPELWDGHAAERIAEILIRV